MRRTPKRAAIGPPLPTSWTWHFGPDGWKICCSARYALISNCDAHTLTHTCSPANSVCYLTINTLPSTHTHRGQQNVGHYQGDRRYPTELCARGHPLCQPLHKAQPQRYDPMTPFRESHAHTHALTWMRMATKTLQTAWAAACAF